jgi:hypothetical protein
VKRTWSVGGIAFLAALLCLLVMLLGVAGCANASSLVGLGVEQAPATTEAAASGQAGVASSQSTSPSNQAQASSEVQLTYESSESPCLIKQVFTQGGKDYIVVDYIVIAAVGADEDGNAELGIVNNNPKLRTFEIPAGAAMTASMTLELLRGDYSPGPITVDELKRAIVKGCINGGAYESWVIKVSNGRVVSLKQERSG